MPRNFWKAIWHRCSGGPDSQAARHRSLRYESLESRLPMAVLPAGFSETTVVSGLERPVAMAMAPDGRMFVAEQGGNLRVIKNGSLLPTPFVHLDVNSSGERGLIGVAIDPNFAVNQYVYVHYTTATSPIHNRVTRFTANGDVANMNSEKILQSMGNLSNATNHNGGAIHFGNDGNLYIAVGDNANGANSQSLNSFMGKILRIRPNGSIPDDNPFYDTAIGRYRTIWAMGLRNPFTFAVNPDSGRIFINDVGQRTWEEINDGIAGSNYGWPTEEGVANNPNFRDPLFAYEHGSTNLTGCAIAGGAFYNPATVQFPGGFVGDYFFADLCNNWIRRYDAGTDSAMSFAKQLPPATVDLLVADDGSLYYLSRGASRFAGQVVKIQYNAPLAQHASILAAADPNSSDSSAATGPVGIDSVNPFAIVNDPANGPPSPAPTPISPASSPRYLDIDDLDHNASLSSPLDSDDDGELFDFALLDRQGEYIGMGSLRSVATNG